jgi:hypothetical protein
LLLGSTSGPPSFVKHCYYILLSIRNTNNNAPWKLIEVYPSIFSSKIKTAMTYPVHAKDGSDGGVEEKKEDEPAALSPLSVPHTGLHHRPSSYFPHGKSEDAVEPMHNRDERNDGFQSHVQNFAKSFLGTCGTALSFLVRGGEGGCQWPGGNSNPDGLQRRPTADVKPPLSITEELRKLAESEGRVFGGGMRRADIPRFLGEEAVYSFDDDNISAISQHTLEEMTKHGIKHPVRRKPSSESSQSASSAQLPPPQPKSFEKRSDESRTSTDPSRRQTSGMEHRDRRLLSSICDDETSK